MVFCDCIPHNLHDEIFVICQSIIDLTKNFLEKVHIEKIIASFVDKYTMRSKAYKSVLRNFLQISVQLSFQKFDSLTSEKKIQKFVLSQLKELGPHPLPERPTQRNRRPNIQ
jgi:hypothetical protein